MMVLPPKVGKNQYKRNLQLETDKIILNTNIPEKLLIESGLKKGQYALPKANIKWIENLDSNNEQIKRER